MLTEQQLAQYSRLNASSPAAELADAVAALVEEAREARSGVAEGERRMATLASQLRARGQWTPFRQHRIHQALTKPLRAEGRPKPPGQDAGHNPGQIPGQTDGQKADKPSGIK